MTVFGIDRKGNLWQISDSDTVIFHTYERNTNFSSLFAVLKTYPSHFLNALFSSDAGTTWNLIVFDYDCPFLRDWQCVIGITIKGQTLYSNDKGNTFTFYEEPRGRQYFQYKWIIAILKFFAINNTLTSLEYGRTWINTSTIKTTSLTAFVNSISSQIIKSEVREVEESELSIPEDLFSRMLEFLPKYERNSRFFREVLSAHAKKVYQVITLAEDLQKQFYVLSSTYGLDLWEEFLNLPKQNLSDEERKTRVLHKLISNAFASLRNIEELASIITGKDVKIVEDFRKQVIVVKDYTGDIPTDSLYLYTQIRELVPAHIGVLFEYRMWDFVDGRYMWDEWDEKGLTWGRMEEVDEEWLNLHVD